MFYLTAENRSLTTRHWIHEDYLTSQVYQKKKKKKKKKNHLPIDPPWEFWVGWQQTKIFLRMVLWCQQISCSQEISLSWFVCFCFFFLNKINDPSVQVHYHSGFMVAMVTENGRRSSLHPVKSSVLAWISLVTARFQNLNTSTAEYQKYIFHSVHLMRFSIC